MADNRIELVAQLNTGESEKVIQSQLGEISKNLTLSVKCDIDANSIKVLQSKLGNISGGAINIDSRSANSSLRAIAEDSDKASSKVAGLANSLADLKSKYSKPIRAVIDNEGFVKAEETMATLKKQLSELGKVEVSGVYGDQFGVNKLEKMIATITSKYGELRTMTFELGDNDLFRFVSGKFDERGVQKQTEEINKFVDNYISKLNSLKAKVGENFAPNISATIGDDLNKTTVTFQTFEEKLLALRDGKGSIEEIRAEFVALDGTVKNLGSLLRGGDSSLNQFTNATNNARNFTNELKALEVEYENLSTATRSDSLFNSLADAQQKLVALQRTQSTEGYTTNWIRQYQELSVAIKQATEDLKLAKKLEQQDSTSAAKQQAQAVKDVAAAYKEIQQYTKTVYNPNAGRNEVANAESNVARLREVISLTVQRLKDEGLLSEEVMRQIQAYDNLATETENILNERRTAVEESKREAQAVSDITKAVKEYGKALNDFNKNRLTASNASNPQVQAQVNTNSDLLNQLNGLSTSLAGDTSATNIERIRSELDALIPKLETAAQDSNKLNASLRDDASARAMQANLDGLINRMNVFASTNAKATNSLKQMRSGTSFADEWNRITQALRSGNLDQNAIKQLGIDFRNFRQEADAAGLTTSKFFTNMNSQLRMVLQRWISIYAIIGYIRKMVEEVKSLDTAMINLKRVTDETDESYQQFLKTANASAESLKTTTSSIVEQSYQWAKLGYSMNEALELANASTIYQRVGDVDQQQALSNLVTALKAYRLEAKDTISIVDKLDKLNNNFAVSASGLGQGLERSASAMAMTGNSLEQTLALLTGAGEITQNLENTGNAIKVASLRLQSMKGALEDLNEPVDDLMEVSKVQTQILNLTGNQVNIFDSATEEFRSTYDILKDISEVWDNLSATNRASLTEILFGKNRANQGLAIIQAFQSGQIESAYKAALNAEGTAVEENERLMQGVAASFDAFKGAFQDLSNAVMKSGFLKSVIDGGTSFLKVLTAIVEKVGALPPLLAAIGAYAGFKNVNMGAGLMSIFGLGTAGSSSSATLAAINNYNSAMQQTNTVAGYNAIIQGTVNRELEAGNVVFANYIKGLNGAKASMAGYTSQLIAAKAQTVALQVGTVALNAAISLGIGLAVSYVATQISKLAKAEEEAQKKASELRQEANKTADSYKEERESLLSLTSDYIKLATTTNDLSSQKEKLLEIQDKINDGFNSEKESVDLLNDSLSKNIDLLNKQSYEDAQDAIRDLGAEYQEALKFMDTESLVFKDKGLYYQSAIDRVTAILGGDNVEQYTDKLGRLQGFTINSGEGLEKNLELIDELLSQYDDYMAGANDEKLYQMYKSEYDIIKKISDEYHKQFQESQNVINNFEIAQKVYDDYGEQLGTDTSARIYEILEAAKELSLTLNDTSSGAEKYTAIQQLGDLEREARELAGTNEILQSDINLVFKSIESGAKSTINSIDDIRSAWFESLDEMEKGAFKNIDTMKSALQNISGGGLLSSTDFWDLAELDIDHILDGAQLVGDQYRVTEEQLIKLKDTYIQKQIEQLRIQNKTLQDQIDGTNGVKDGLKKQLEFETMILETKLLANGVNSAGDARLVSETRARINSIKEQMKGYGDEISRNDMLIRQLNASLGNTVDRQQQLTDLTKNLQSQADNLLKAQEYRIDQIIDKYEGEKEAIEDAKKVLEDQLAILEEQEDSLKNTIENYKTVAEVVQSAIQEQIDKIKEENEERENALDLATKLANLENARNKKVRIYTEAGGWQYEAKKSDVEKAERELEKTKEDERIKLLEAQLKKWQNITDKRQKAEDERLAEEILGADWRLKISEQDEEIFNKYEKEYDAYGDQLWTISNIEIATLKKSIEVKDKEIAAKEAQIKEWQKYKSAVQKAAEDVKNANADYLKYLNDVKIDENSTLQDREDNLTRFRNTYAGILEELTAKQNELNTAANNYDTSSMLGQVNSLAEEMEQLEIKWDKVYEMMRNNHYAGSASDAEYYYGYRVGEGYADGGVSSTTGLAMLHGTKQRSETIFNANDSAKLYDLVHNTPSLMASVLTDGVNIARSLNGRPAADSRSVTLNGTVINLPNVQNADQFARQFESYMQTVLAESQVYKPSR